MRKLHLPASVYSTYYKDMHVVKVVMDNCDMPDMGWEILREIAEANDMNVQQMCAELDHNMPFVFDSFAEFNEDVIDMSNIDETFKDVKDERKKKAVNKGALN